MLELCVAEESEGLTEPMVANPNGSQTLFPVSAPTPSIDSTPLMEVITTRGWVASCSGSKAFRVAQVAIS